ncbi:hypothetical protein [Dactylosporangium sp. NPDC006015]|uniref:hypothetical protein n=1 Tax=Dactylosporangium sp. NPDC006015 TaxID=3154576 RepID=UPI0033AA856F
MPPDAPVRLNDRVPRAWTAVGDYSTDQVAPAATIVTADAAVGVPARGWVLAVTVAIQESSLHNRTDAPAVPHSMNGYRLALTLIKIASPRS